MDSPRYVGSHEEILKAKSFAYKVIYIENGLLLLFERLRRFSERDIKVKMVKRDLIVELGNNVFLLTEDMMDHLVKTNNLFLYEVRQDAYEAKKLGSAFTTSPEILARIQGAWDVLKEELRGINYSSS